jgi:hypothetical protein
VILTIAGPITVMRARELLSETLAQKAKLHPELEATTCGSRMNKTP